MNVRPRASRSGSNALQNRRASCRIHGDRRLGTNRSTAFCHPRRRWYAAHRLLARILLTQLNSELFHFRIPSFPYMKIFQGPPLSNLKLDSDTSRRCNCKFPLQTTYEKARCARTNNRVSYIFINRIKFSCNNRLIYT